MKKKILLLGALASLATVTVSTVTQTTVAYAETESSKLTQAQQAVSQAQRALEQANQAVTVATNDLNVSKARVDDAQNKVDSLPTFTLTPEYVAYLKEQRTPGGHAAASAKLKAINDSVKALNVYTQNNDDKTRMISDINRMSVAEQQELTFFAQALMNQIRSQMGTPKAHVSNGSVRFASLVTPGYLIDNWDSWNNGHDVQAINEGARSSGLKAGQNNYYENLNTTLTSQQSMSMAEAKEYVYKAFLSFMFNGGEWAHAASIAGLESTSEVYLGVSMSQNGGQLRVHVLDFENKNVVDASKIDLNILQTTLPERSILQQQLSEAQMQYTISETVYNNAIAKQKAAQQALNQAQAALAAAQPKPKPAPKPTPPSSSSSSKKNTQQPASLQSVFRMYNPGLQVHLYTTDTNEYKVLSTRGWRQEGTAWKTETSKGQPVYRMYNPGLKVHLYTKDANEYKVLSKRGWRQEGVAYRSSGSVKIYRMYHPGIKKHLYTKDANEYKVLSKRGWRQEGIAWYSK
ncbi:SEC10/PgrA surface exclusion domain-containing protein [Streptococcus cuniculi]|uniref:SEC10/PgrA surface exclusion domain-containing protein n=1 Tax=Streptococcus cuniculi TaxID=1432788 RepID=A0A4Y9JC56_9STRE|nr:SEC10/PgrA surface exclusion domain-containing protein [Streptococcus cuniculi]MBF0777544.1 SEC10/PgrA surface exclusion domain-containing protein [Streptococcus cuniculi]TFU98590.1 SEC10/PgrA surface exclusion domain-containing protein [Streptococcus cuniculi]